MSAGNVKTRDGDILVRTDGQAYTRADYARIPIINTLGADPVLLGDIANIKDGFEDQPLFTRFDDQASILLDIKRTGEQSSIQISNLVKEYVATQNQNTENGNTLRILG